MVSSPPRSGAAVLATANFRSMTKSTISVRLGSDGLCWQRFLDGRQAETNRPSAGKVRAGRGTRADHRDDVVAVDGARQSAQTGGDAALQAHAWAFLGRIWPGRQPGPAS